MPKPKPAPIVAHCPNCGEILEEKFILDSSRRILSRIGGKATGASKVRDHATLSAAAKRRWERVRAEKAAQAKASKSNGVP